MPSWLVDLALVVIVIGAVVLVFRDRVDDSAWEERWQALDAADRSRIAAAVRRGGLLADPEEIDLAAGYARRELRRNSPGTLRLAVLVLLSAALIITGSARDSGVLLVFGGIFLFGVLWQFRTELQNDPNLREAASRGQRP